MSNSEPSAIVLHGIPGIGGLYISFDSNGEIGSLRLPDWRSPRFTLSRSRLRSRTGFASPVENQASWIAKYPRLRVHREDARMTPAKRCRPSAKQCIPRPPTSRCVKDRLRGRRLSNSISSRSYASKEKARSGNITLAMQPANSGLSRRALSMAGPQCSYTIARSHSRRLLILLPWISMAIAWSRSMTSCLRVMRWTASTFLHSISYRGLSKAVSIKVERRRC